MRQLDEIRAVTDALRAAQDAEVNERAARDLLTSAFMHREGVAEAIDLLQRATEARRERWWEALDAARIFGDGIPDPEQFAQ